MNVVYTSHVVFLQLNQFHYDIPVSARYGMLGDPPRDGIYFNLPVQYALAEFIFNTVFLSHNGCQIAL